jgi:hypothetical protein
MIHQFRIYLKFPGFLLTGTLLLLTPPPNGGVEHSPVDGCDERVFVV